MKISGMPLSVGEYKKVIALWYRRKEEMKTMDMTKLDGSGFVLHFGGKTDKINAIAFGKALIYLVQATELIGNKAFPESNVNISIGSVKPGSLITDLVVNFAGGFGHAAGAAVGGALFYKIWCLLSKSEPDSMRDCENGIFIKDKDREIRISKETYEIASRTQSIPELKDLIVKPMKTMNGEPSMESLGIGNSDERTPEMLFPRSAFPIIIKNSLEVKTREIDYRDVTTILQVRIPVLDRSPRRWEFVWNNKKIMASVTDNDFFYRLENGKIAIKQGDEFKVSLRIYGNGKKYEVIKFH